MPIVDFFRVFGNGRYLGKTKTMSFCLRKSREGDGRSGNRARGEEEDDDGDCPTRDYFRLLHSPDQVQFLYCRVLSELVVQQTDAPKIHTMEKSLSSRGSRRICRAPQPHTLSSSRTSRNLSPRYRTKRSQSSQPSWSKVAPKEPPWSRIASPHDHPVPPCPSPREPPCSTHRMDLLSRCTG